MPVSLADIQRDYGDQSVEYRVAAEVIKEEAPPGKQKGALTPAMFDAYFARPHASAYTSMTLVKAMHDDLDQYGTTGLALRAAASSHPSIVADALAHLKQDARLSAMADVHALYASADRAGDHNGFVTGDEMRAFLLSTNLGAYAPTGVDDPTKLSAGLPYVLTDDRIAQLRYHLSTGLDPSLLRTAIPAGCVELKNDYLRIIYDPRYTTPRCVTYLQTPADLEERLDFKRDGKSAPFQPDPKLMGNLKDWYDDLCAHSNDYATANLVLHGSKEYLLTNKQQDFTFDQGHEAAYDSHGDWNNAKENGYYSNQGVQYGRTNRQMYRILEELVRNEVKTRNVPALIVVSELFLDASGNPKIPDHWTLGRQGTFGVLIRKEPDATGALHDVAVRDAKTDAPLLVDAQTVPLLPNMTPQQRFNAALALLVKARPELADAKMTVAKSLPIPTHRAISVIWDPYNPTLESQHASAWIVANSWKLPSKGDGYMPLLQGTYVPGAVAETNGCRTTINTVEKATGIDLFSALPKPAEVRLEAMDTYYPSPLPPLAPGNS